MQQQVHSRDGAKLFLNPHVAVGSQKYGSALQDILSRKAFAIANEAIQQWAGYQPTELYALTSLAESLNVATVYYKDESTRFGLGSFKALGGAYAVNRLLLREVRKATGNASLERADLSRSECSAIVKDITVACATDGNHGRSVAWGAQNAGCRCVIYIHGTVSKGREEAIAAYGATVIRVPGNYDDAVRRAAEDAEKYGYFVVSDTSYPGYMDVPKDVMQGYSVMVQEALDQIGNKGLPTHVFIQGGVGGLAAAVCAHLWETLADKRPKIIVVEPEKADCLFQSALAGKPVAVSGELDTVMAGLACGEVSLLAWDILYPGATAFMTIPDQMALDAMCRLARAGTGDKPIVAGESAVAGVAASQVVAGYSDWRDALGLDSDSRILFFASEGDTDPELYTRIVGKTAADVRAQEAL